MRKRRSRRLQHERGAAAVEYAVLLGGLLAISLSAHPPFAVKLSYGLCVSALVLSWEEIEDTHFCKDDALWRGYGYSPPSEDPAIDICLLDTTHAGGTLTFECADRSSYQG